VRRKTGHFNQRVDEDNPKPWQECADEAGLSLASWMEAVCNREVLARRRQRLLDKMYSQKKASSV
jgi:predicted HicB family RNase H-like nuclease